MQIACWQGREDQAIANGGHALAAPEPLGLDGVQAGCWQGGWHCEPGSANNHTQKMALPAVHVWRDSPAMLAVCVCSLCRNTTHLLIAVQGGLQADEVAST